MKVKADEMRKLFEQGMRKSEDAECPSTEILVEATRDALNASERKKLADHIANCHHCAEDLRLALGIASPIQEMIERLGMARHPPRLRPAVWWWSGIAAVAFFGVGIATWYSLVSSPTTPSTVRGESTAEAVAGIALEPPDGGNLDLAPIRFRWMSEAAATYRFVLYDDESLPLWEKETGSANEVSLPGEIQAELRPGSTYYWRVLIREDLEERQSPLYRFHLRK